MWGESYRVIEARIGRPVSTVSRDGRAEQVAGMGCWREWSGGRGGPRRLNSAER